MRDENEINVLLEKFQKPAYALALYLVYDSDQAYELAARACAQVLTERVASDDDFAVKLYQTVIDFCRGVKIIPVPQDDLPPDMSVQRYNQLMVVKKALQGLEFTDKALILLRDQRRLPYNLIAKVIRVSENDARAGTLDAMIRLREGVKGALENG
jgi:DNA-directed RNA polymerase specialized sigma24 family protein